MTTVKIAAKDVAALRARTGAGMGECKKALEEAGGDIERAIEILRAKGIAKAERRACRVASEGQIVTWLSDDRTLGVMVELNSETDFVAKNDEFVAFAKLVAAHIGYDTSLDGVAEIGAQHELLDKRWAHDKSRTLSQVVKEVAALTGENVGLRRVARFTSGGTIGAYRHFNGRIGALVEVRGATSDAAVSLANSVAEHVAGAPTVAVAVRKEEVPDALVERERAIFVEQAKQSGKPEAIVEKMVAGRVAKLYREITLLEQPWVRDDSRTIARLVSEIPGATVRRFARFKMGEA